MFHMEHSDLLEPLVFACVLKTTSPSECQARQIASLPLYRRHECSIVI